MATIELVTVTGCKQARCLGCDQAEGIVRQVASMAGVELPKHGVSGEVYLAEDQTVQISHIGCAEAEDRRLDPALAPYLFVDGQLVHEGPGVDGPGVARAVLRRLMPHGLADLRR